MDRSGEEKLGGGTDQTGLIVDFLLHEGSIEDRHRVQEQLDHDPLLAIECAELGGLFETLRTLDPEPSSPDRMRLAVRYALRRREDLRSSGPSLGEMFWAGLRTTLVAAAALTLIIGGAWVYDLVGGQVESDGYFAGEDAQAKFAARQAEAVPVPDFTSGDPHLDLLLASTRSVIQEAGPLLQRSFRALGPKSDFARGLGGGLSTLARQVEADNMLSRLREELSLRESDKIRRRVSQAFGGPDLEPRIQQLASTVARQIQAELDRGEASVAATAGALRALLAAGSLHKSGAHSEVVKACFEALRQTVSSLEGGALAIALSGIGEYAVVHGGEAGELVGREAGRLARETISALVPARPALMHWRTPVAELAEAGRVFRIAPAFGTHPDLARLAREFVAAHLAERLASGAERPSLAAAQLYGFGDIVDREAAEHRLMLWRANLLIPDYQALHHLAWSKFPVRPGWAQFQTELRGLAAEPTPAQTTDAASLLLCLSMNFAAPGALDVVLLSRL